MTEMAHGGHADMAHEGHAGMSMEGMVRDMRNRFLVAAIFSIPIVLWSSIGRSFLHFTVPAPFGLRDDQFQLLLSLPVVFYSGRIFFEGAVRARVGAYRPANCEPRTLCRRLSTAESLPT